MIHAARLCEYTDDLGAHPPVDADETTALAPDTVAVASHIHDPAQAPVDGEFAFRESVVGQYTELQELVALVERDEADLHAGREDSGDINEVTETPEHREVDCHAVITP